jgi:hypothetical protein
MPRLLIFGPGYTASRIADVTAASGWAVDTVGRSLIDEARAVETRIAAATHILSSIPPAGEEDPVLVRYRPILARSSAWLGYLSSTGVYGDTGGAWADETAPVGHGRRSARTKADLDWLALGARVFRLPGIYGQGRSPLDKVRAGQAYRVEQPGQLFSRIHVDDIVAAVAAAWDAPPGAYNIADDFPAPQDAVVAYAARLIGAPLPPLVALDSLAPAARAFYSESRRIANGKAKRLLGWRPAYPTYREGLRALSATSSPASASPLPAAAVQDQR